ncbi:hypothetical protein PPL_12145 [Heterostelium album PN500]|uniref:Uncharacterized protein n=1 Tax=Heterostelium pallidum (strain ATCC 26659 / Pp 5 / PN500) TaxID=670386 RepID=D3BLU1_HETP5|nr:hypothetical protein PPL_12145 [Heterostelium album PN500]EFA77542.1 hypothetical protein PPL_12145 [Heterostelium album PN500]|eukprot:XP_020429670.1 hypothetical protein PPL_12145 [Heterostelium album PN500]
MHYRGVACTDAIQYVDSLRFLSEVQQIPIGNRNSKESGFVKRKGVRIIVDIRFNVGAEESSLGYNKYRKDSITCANVDALVWRSLKSST